MAQQRGRWLLLLMIGLLAASVWRTGLLERDKQGLTRAYQEARQALQVLEGERTRLANEVTQATTLAQSQAAELTNLQQTLTQVQARLERAHSELASLQMAHEMAKATNASLEHRVADLESEKAQLETRLSSLDELRLALRQVRRRLLDQRWAAWRAKIEAQREADRLALAEGNRGFIVRQGTSTLGAKTRLHVRVLDVQSK